MKPTIEQIKQILEGAPEDMTHIDLDDMQYECYGNGTKCLEDLKAILDQAREIEKLQSRVVELEGEINSLAAHVERLKSACELARDSHNKMLMTDPPQCAWKHNQVTARLVEAIAATPSATLAERVKRGDK